MKISQSSNYNPEFPETFPWGHSDSLLVCNVAGMIVSEIEHDLRTPDRNLVPGLRTALRTIAQYAEV